MKTLEETVNRIISLGGSKQLLSLVEIKELPMILKEDETIEQIVECFKDGTGILVATNLRVIFVYKGILGGLKVEDFTYSKISSISYEIGLVVGRIMLCPSSENRVEFKHIEKKNTRQFAEFVRTMISPSTQASSPSQTTSNALTDDILSKLERLAVLKQQGILTEEEFLEQKKKIIG
jgi:hypothetical protein